MSPSSNTADDNDALRVSVGTSCGCGFDIAVSAALTSHRTHVRGLFGLRIAPLRERADGTPRRRCFARNAAPPTHTHNTDARAGTPSPTPRHGVQEQLYGSAVADAAAEGVEAEGVDLAAGSRWRRVLPVKVPGAVPITRVQQVRHPLETEREERGSKWGCQPLAACPQQQGV
jgi:hypothetical protein